MTDRLDDDMDFPDECLRFLVVSMQLGFAMLEVGGVREAHRLTVLAKNLGRFEAAKFGLGIISIYYNYLSIIC